MQYEQNISLVPLHSRLHSCGVSLPMWHHIPTRAWTADRQMATAAAACYRIQKKHKIAAEHASVDAIEGLVQLISSLIRV